MSCCDLRVSSRCVSTGSAQQTQSYLGFRCCHCHWLIWSHSRLPSVGCGRRVYVCVGVTYCCPVVGALSADVMCSAQY